VYIAVAVENRNAASVAQTLAADATDPSQGINQLINLLAAVNGGAISGRVYCAVDDAAGVAGTATVTCTQANATAGETVTICGVTFTIVATESSDAAQAMNQVTAGASDAAFGENLKNKINAHPKLRTLVTATDNDAGVVTVTFKDKGLHANLAVLAETGDAFAVTQVTNGAEGTLSASLKAFAKGV
jgi:hypothetical protein